MKQSATYQDIDFEAEFELRLIFTGEYFKFEVSDVAHRSVIHM